MEVCKKCQKPVFARGLCYYHWYKFRQSDEYTPMRRKNNPETWKCENCGVGWEETPTHVMGLCNKCYLRLKRYGNAKYGTRRKWQNQTKHPLYHRYQLMKQRCYLPSNPQYPNYGGRGIKVCDRWLGMYGFEHFLKDMGNPPKGYLLDRIDVNGNYEYISPETGTTPA